jgi:hypothetical protein
MYRYVAAVTGIALVGIAGCRADRETFERGATLETPPAVEQAPATPIPPQPIEFGGTTTGETLPPVDPDTITAEHIRAPAEPAATTRP